jgi:glycosyltransferase involved in cell wall biosynthesis
MTVHQFLVSRDFGGAAVMALELANFLAVEGERVEVWVPGAGPATTALEAAGLHWRQYPLDTFRQARARRLWAWLALAYRLKSLSGLAHIHLPGVYRVLLPALRLAGARTVVHVQIDTSPDELRWAFRTPPDLIITCANYLVAAIRDALGDDREQLRIVSVPNAVDIDRFFPGDRVTAKKRVGAPADRPLVLMLANLAPHKGQETALRAVAALKARGYSVECWFAGLERGGGLEYRQRLELLATDLGVEDRARFLGHRTDAPDLLRAADFFLLPSTQEGLPLSILEAQATRVPVLAAPTAGVPEVVCDGKTGYLVRADDAISYADRIQSLMQAPSEAQQVTEAAYLRVTRENNTRNYCQRVFQLYQELLHRRAPARRPRVG